MSRRQRQLLAWSAAVRRHLPWRNTAEPYRVLIAEVMAQQTQASRITAHHERFLASFPDVAALAAAPLADVVAAWRGLGYNARAKRLRDAARIIHRDGWPTTPAELQRLPGVGQYTAAAIACFAFGADVAVVDTNVRRVLSRWRGEPLAGAALSAEADTALARPAPAWNQALMDLGALVCTPRSPDCAACPVSEWCSGPETYAAPPPQGRFAGSQRQARGAVLRELATGPATLAELRRNLDVPTDRLRQALAGLERDGMVIAAARRYRIAD